MEKDSGELKHSQHFKKKDIVQEQLLYCTKQLEEKVTDILQSFHNSENILTFIQDSNQLLYRLRNLPPLNENSTLISSDVAALYPSIPHKEGLEAIHNFLVEYSLFDQNQIIYIMKALKLVITHNYVMWNGKIYIRKIVV